MIELIDTHCHLSMLTHDDSDLIIKRAQECHVTHFVSVSTELSNFEANRLLAESYSFIYYSLGLHPHEAIHWEEVAPVMDKYFESNQVPHKCVAIGEIGLDYYYDHSPREKQLEVLEKQILLARKVDLPIIVHCREAFDDFFEVIDRVGTPKKVLLHCFTGTVDEAKEAVKRGYTISLSGIVTFKKSIELQEVARQVPLESLVIETDCPFLSPEPMRGKNNEPSYLLHTAQKLADLREVSLEWVSKQTTLNAKAFFEIE